VPEPAFSRCEHPRCRSSQRHVIFSAADSGATHHLRGHTIGPADVRAPKVVTGKGEGIHRVRARLPGKTTS